MSLTNDIFSFDGFELFFNWSYIPSYPCLKSILAFLHAQVSTKNVYTHHDNSHHGRCQRATKQTRYQTTPTPTNAAWLRVTEWGNCRGDKLRPLFEFSSREREILKIRLPTENTWSITWDGSSVLICTKYQLF